jgi:hypothetical protein
MAYTTPSLTLIGTAAGVVLGFDAVRIYRDSPLDSACQTSGSETGSVDAVLCLHEEW